MNKLHNAHVIARADWNVYLTHHEDLDSQKKYDEQARKEYCEQTTFPDVDNTPF